MRVVPVAISETDAVHIYSDPEHIWLQLRRHVPTAKTITTTSFKTTLTLTPQQAVAIANELITVAKEQSSQPNGAGKQPSAAKPQPPKPVSK
jgi:aspartokinase